MKLFEPGRIGKLFIKNRIVMSSMGIGGLAEPDGRLGERAIDYYVARAKGGVGLITTAAARVEREIDPTGASFLGTDGSMYIAPLSELADAVHDYGAKIIVQLTAGRGRIAPLDYLKRFGAVAPSSVPCFANPKIIARELTTAEVERLVEAFALAAVTLDTAGIDGIELHAHDGYLLDQFQTTLWNQRKDRYGGDIDGRLQFSKEIISAIRKAVNRDFPIIYRFGLTHYFDGGREIEEGLEIVQRLERVGVDAFHIDAGCYETRYWAIPPPTQPPGCMVNLAEMVKKIVKVPVIAVGKLGDPGLAEMVLQEGKADFIALGRPLLADPDWANKVREEIREDIRPCIGCYEGCLIRIYKKKYISCAVNPQTGMEREFAIEPAEKKKNVLVLGGGPGGMEAARVAALRGHSVTLWEKSKALGGHLVPASVPDFKRDFKSLIHYQSAQIKNLGVAIELNKEATPKQILEMEPEVLFVATGATPMIPEIPGVRKEKVVTAIDVLWGKKDVENTVVVIGGGLVGCETALYLAQKGKNVSIVEILDNILGDVFIAIQMHLQELLANAGAKIFTETNVLEIREEGLLVADKKGGKRLVAGDTIVLATGMKHQENLFEDLECHIPEVYFIGDRVEPRKVLNAIWEGFRLARLV
jgi:2-enoate reductase